jgi:small subunit ribosomal protein S6
MRHYEVMVILDPELDERTIAPSLDAFLSVVKKDGGSVEKVDIWGKRRLAFEINKRGEGIYAVIDLNAEPASVIELDRQLNLNESVLRTKVLRPTVKKAAAKKAAAPKLDAPKAEAPRPEVPIADGPTVDATEDAAVTTSATSA